MSFLGFLAETSPILNVAGAALDLTGNTLAILKPRTRELPRGINGYLFSIPLTESVTMESQITDHWTQDNVAIQDHVAKTPIKLTLTGKVGSLVWEKSALQAYAEQLITRLTSLDALKPGMAQQSIDFLANFNELNRQANQLKNQITDVAQLINRDLPRSTNQNIAYSQMFTLWNTRALCTVETPWETFSNMVIENVTVSQDETTRDVTDITVNFKQINAVIVTSTKVQLSEKAKSQRDSQVNQGQVKGASIAKQAGSVIGGFFK